MTLVFLYLVLFGLAEYCYSLQCNGKSTEMYCNRRNGLDKSQIESVYNVPLEQSMTEAENSQEQMFFPGKEGKAKRHKVHRNRVKMMADVLDAARNGALKTHIMYSSNLSYTNLTELLDFLMKNGLLREDCDIRGRGASLTKYYSTTSKGYQFLEQFGQLRSLLRDPEKMLEDQYQF